MVGICGDFGSVKNLLRSSNTENELTDQHQIFGPETVVLDFLCQYEFTLHQECHIVDLQGSL